MVPGAAEFGIGFEDGGADAEVLQAFDLIDAGDAGTDYDDLVVRRRLDIFFWMDQFGGLFGHAFSFQAVGRLLLAARYRKPAPAPERPRVCCGVP